METEARWTVDQVLALAPDDSSRKAGARLAVPTPWSATGTAGAAVWGLCKGSGSKPYQTVVDLDGPAFRCTCPSRKFPCKHALGLLLLWAQEPGGAIGPGEEPEWARQWTAARRKKKEDSAAAAAAAAGRGSGAGHGGDQEEEQLPPSVAAAAEAARRRAERREIRVEGGAVELEQRLTDLLRGGLAGAERGGYQQWEETAARMVDAQAPGLASRVRELGALVGAGGDWPSRVLEQTALLHLLARGHLGRERLPAPLAQTVRARVGFTVDAAEVLATGPGIRARWSVLAQYDTAEERLTTRRVWLHDEVEQRFALLLSYGAAGRAPELSLPVGSVLDAEVVYYPSAVPLRAVLRRSGPGGPAAPGGTGPGGVPAGAPGGAGPGADPAAAGAGLPGRVPRGVGVAAALDSYGAALADDPWLEGWPVILSDVVPVATGSRWQLADAGGTDAVPLAGSAPPWRLVAVAGGEGVRVFAELGPAGARPLAVWPCDGPLVRCVPGA